LIFSGLDSFNYTISDGFDGTDNATVTVTVIGQPSSNLTKTANATLVLVGDAVKFFYDEANDGNTQLTNVKVTDDSCSPVVFVGGDTNLNGILDPNEIFRFECENVFDTAGTFTNIAIGNATDPFGNFITFPFDPDQIANATVTVNSSPVANNDFVTTLFNTSIEIDVLANDTDAEKGT